MEENKTDELLAQGGEASENMAQADGTSDTVQRAGTLEDAQDAASESTQSGASENTQGSEIPVTTQEQDTREAQIPETGTSNDIWPQLRRSVATGADSLSQLRSAQSRSGTGQ